MSSRCAPTSRYNATLAPRHPIATGLKTKAPLLYKHIPKPTPKVSTCQTVDTRSMPFWKRPEIAI